MNGSNEMRKQQYMYECLADFMRDLESRINSLNEDINSYIEQYPNQEDIPYWAQDNINSNKLRIVAIQDLIEKLLKLKF